MSDQLDNSKKLISTRDQIINEMIDKYRTDVIFCDIEKQYLQSILEDPEQVKNYHAYETKISRVYASNSTPNNDPEAFIRGEISVLGIKYENALSRLTFVKNLRNVRKDMREIKRGSFPAEINVSFDAESK